MTSVTSWVKLSNDISGMVANPCEYVCLQNLPLRRQKVGSYSANEGKASSTQGKSYNEKKVVVGAGEGRQKTHSTSILHLKQGFEAINAT